MGKYIAPWVKLCFHGAMDSSICVSTPDPAGIPALGLRLREQRRGSGRTLEAAAQRLGLSAAHLSRMESGLRQPSLPVLLALARLYGVTVSDLLGETNSGRDPIVRGGLMDPVPAGGWTYWRSGGTGRAMQALRIHVPPEAQDRLVRVHPGEEWLYVLRGRLRLTLGETVHTLDESDAAHFDSLVPHRLAAAGPDGVDVLFLHTLMQSEATTLCVTPEAPTTGREPR